ncbi:hypothetical protein JW710_05005 [Candidatus Dojkabacteria bacterium]|nr:hypothetical protein [Candidatus Dojkabacteria bacterium]
MKPSCSRIQKEVADLYTHNNWKTEPTLLLLAMQEELGELSSRWLAEHPGYKKDIITTDPIEEEIGDLGQLILQFCNRKEVDFEQCVRESIKKRRKQA